jgi:hypothetical protein
MPGIYAWPVPLPLKYFLTFSPAKLTVRSPTASPACDLGARTSRRTRRLAWRPGHLSQSHRLLPAVFLDRIQR